ncbi:DUF1853 family protein [Candidatus Protochlamydia phocaeensis]|uniref:DUF1853 family protein n=1 Tax=Candidatus Protochlamydia phocaeensis TaxID=1414722 RepID=UPI000838BD7C|nr:DUF1853 family protein [Candidatus Protochlamydia phocaeensis]
MFKHKPVRDLAWVIQSCPLIDPSARLPCVTWQECQKWYAQFLPELETLDRDPVPLLTHLSSFSSKRLGDYFAHLIEFWLQRRPDIERLHACVQIRDERTIGEFDFIFFSLSEQRLLHWEVSVKYYLSYTSQLETFFLGPNPHDRMASKLERLSNHQLHLSRHPLAQLWISQHYGSMPASQCFIKGYLFYPWGEPLNATAVPPEAHIGHLRGWWIAYLSNSWEKWKSQEDGGQTRWAILPKLYWLSAYLWNGQDGIGLFEKKDFIAAVETHFEQHMHSLMAAQLTLNKQGEWEEAGRGILVAPQWPFWE